MRKIDDKMTRQPLRGSAMVRRRCTVLLLSVALVFSGCTRAPLNPPRLVVSSETDMAIQLFMQATILMANYYGYDQITYAEVKARTRRAGLNPIAFMAPESVRATPELLNLVNRFEDDPTQLAAIVQRIGGYKNLVKYYIRTGLRASQSICRSYLLDLDEKSEYLDFIEKEVGVGYALSSAVLALVHANTTLTTSFLIARTGFDGALGVYQDYRYLSIDREAARAVVEAAQNKYAQYFMQQVDLTTTNSNLVAGGYTFSDALHAVSTIEYQCTRSGIKALLARSINNSPSNLMVDPRTGALTFISSASAPPTDTWLGGVPPTENGNTGSNGVLIPPGGSTSGDGTPRRPRATPAPTPTVIPTPTPTVSPTPRPTVSPTPPRDQNQSFNPAAVIQACTDLATKTTTQGTLCTFVNSGPNRPAQANAALQSEMQLPTNALVLPARFGLAEVIRDGSDTIEVARARLVRALRAQGLIHN